MTDTKESPLLVSLPEIERQTGWSRKRIYEYAALPNDPLPLRYVIGTQRGGVAIAQEFTEWLKRNTTTYSERG